MKSKDFVDKGQFNDETNPEFCFIAYERTESKEGYNRFKINTERTHFCCEPFGKEFKIEGYQGHELALFFRVAESYRRKTLTPQICIYGGLEVYDGELNYEGVPIQKCPFCGKEIKFGQVKHLKEVKVGCEEITKKVCKFEFKEVK